MGVIAALMEAIAAVEGQIRVLAAAEDRGREATARVMLRAGIEALNERLADYGQVIPADDHGYFVGASAPLLGALASFREQAPFLRGSMVQARFAEVARAADLFTLWILEYDQPKPWDPTLTLELDETKENGFRTHPGNEA